MKKIMNKKIIVLVALVLALVGEIDARGGIGFGFGIGSGYGWGGRGRYWGAPGWGWGPGIGFGVGFGGGRGRRYYNRPYYDYDYYDDGYYNNDDYYEPDVVYSTPRPYKKQTYVSEPTYVSVSPKQYIDKSGNTQWKFTNNTPFAIRVRALRGGGRESINPGESKNVSRGESYQFLVKSDNGHRQVFEGQNHSIGIIEESGDLVAVEENSTNLQGA